MPAPDTSTSHIAQDLPPGYHSPWRQPLYSWQYTPSRLTSSPTTTTNCFPFSSHQSSTRKRSRSVRPGTLTRTELLEYPNQRLQWLSPSTPTTFKNSSPPSSASRNGSRLRKPSTPTGTPSATTATASATHPNAVSSPPPRTPFVRFTILVQPTDAKTPPAQRGATPGLSQAAAPPLPPTARTVAATTMPSRRNAGLDLPHLQDRRPPPPGAEEPESDSDEDMDMEDDGGQAPSTPKATTTQPGDLTTPSPPRRDLTSTGGPTPPVNETPQRVRPGNE